MSESNDPYELRARLHRIMAGRLRVAAAEQEMAAAAVMTAKSMKEFAAAWNAGIARDVAEHPDLAELNVQLDSYYGPSDVDASQGQRDEPTQQWCKCRSCWGWFVEEHPGEDLDELGKDLGWWAGLPEHRDAPSTELEPGT